MYNRKHTFVEYTLCDRREQTLYQPTNEVRFLDTFSLKDNSCFYFHAKRASFIRFNHVVIDLPQHTLNIVAQLANGVRLGLPLATTRQVISHFLGCQITKKLCFIPHFYYFLMIFVFC